MTEVERITDPDRIVFPNLGIDVNIDSTAFTIFGMDIKWYGIIISMGVLLAMVYCFPKMKKFGIDPDRAIDAVIGGIIGGIIGARLYYVIFQWDIYKDDILSIFNFRNGGLAIYGGIIGAILIGGIVCKIRDVKLLPMLDIAGIGFLIGQGVGRWGNFVNQEAFGSNTDNLFAMTGGTIQNTIIGTDISELYGVHPCFLYESVWCLTGVLVLTVLSKKRKFDGQLFLIYLSWYGAGRFFIEGLRTDSLMIGNIRVSQLLAAICVISSVIIHIVMLSRAKRYGIELYCNSEEYKSKIETENVSENKEDNKNGTNN